MTHASPAIWFQNYEAWPSSYLNVIFLIWYPIITLIVHMFLSWNKYIKKYYYSCDILYCYLILLCIIINIICIIDASLEKVLEWIKNPCPCKFLYFKQLRLLLTKYTLINLTIVSLSLEQFNIIKEHIKEVLSFDCKVSKFFYRFSWKNHKRSAY